MKRCVSHLNLFVVVAWLSGLMLAPIARPIIEPRAIVLAVVTCRNQVTGAAVVTDSQGRTYTLGCSADQPAVFNPVRQSPAEDAPWLVTITARPASLREGLPTMCRSQITRAPIHFQCAAISATPLAVDFDLICTPAFGGM